MGIYDRDYERGGGYGQQPGLHLDGPKTLTTKIVLITIGVYALQLIVANSTLWLQLPSEWYNRPWEFYRLLSYGFVHDPRGFEHILVNMLVFWMFGRDLEAKYGPREFLWFYLTAIVFAGLGWSLCETLGGGRAVVVGASGGVSAVFALYALNYPHRKVLFMFFLPMPMWIAALIGILYDINMAMDRSGGIAGSAHLAGALFGLLYYKYKFAPGLWLVDRLTHVAPKSRPNLRVHAPDDPDAADDDEVDEILKKIQAHGQDSLTRRERKILERASQAYQRKRR